MDGGKRSRERNSPSYIVGLHRPARPTGPWLQRELGNSHAKIMKKLSLVVNSLSPPDVGRILHSWVVQLCSCQGKMLGPALRLHQHAGALETAMTFTENY